MNITKIIMPKTDPDVLRELAKNRIEEIRKEPTYQEVLDIKNKHDKIFYYTYGDLCWYNPVYATLSIFIGIGLITIPNIIGKIFASIFISYSITAMIAAFYSFWQLHIYDKVIKTYKDTIKDRLHEYMISDIFDNDQHNFINCGCIIDIDNLKKFIKDEDVSYIITHPIATKERYIDKLERDAVLLCKIKNGQIIDQMEIYSFRYDHCFERESWIISNGAIDLSAIDDHFWAGETPYYEKEKNYAAE